MEIKQVLIVQTAFIGDVILITPLIRAVKQLYPSALLDVMVVPGAAKLLENNPHIRRVIPFYKRNGAISSFLSTVKQLRDVHYDLAISPHSSGRTHLLLWLGGIPRRIGFDRSILPQLLTDRIPHPTGMHKLAKNLMLLSFLSQRQFPLQTELFPSKTDVLTAQEHLKPLTPKKLIAIAPGSIWATKCWLLSSFITLAHMLKEKGFAIVLIGAEQDRDKCDAIETALKHQDVVNLAGKTNLLESAAVIDRCALMVCNDSGALHIANAMQTTVFAIFGPTVQSIGYYPYRNGDRVFEADLTCRPCGSHGASRCPLGHHNCMKLVSPQQVFDSILLNIPVATAQEE